MALQNFVSKVTQISAAWLNAVDVLLNNIFDNATTKAAARAALTSDAPMSIVQGGTNAVTAAAARTSLGATTVGDAVFIAASAAAARTAAGAAALTDAAQVITAANLAFPATQVPSADPNTLDDYEEGTWTPTVGGSSTYTAQSGRYIKLGRLLYFTGSILINLIGTGNDRNVLGLPFTNAGVHTEPVFVSFFGALATAVVLIVGEAQFTTIEFFSTTAASTGVSSNAVFGNSSNINFSGSYIVSA